MLMVHDPHEWTCISQDDTGSRSAYEMVIWKMRGAASSSTSAWHDYCIVILTTMSCVSTNIATYMALHRTMEPTATATECMDTTEISVVAM